jgi:hypothetical protein
MERSTFSKIALTCVLMLAPFISHSQQRKLKARQPNMIELTLFEIRLNPNDTIFNNVCFDYLPVKGFPFFTADPRKDLYTIEQRDSVMRKIDDMFFE